MSWEVRAGVLKLLWRIVDVALGSVIGDFILVEGEVLAVGAAYVPSHVVKCSDGYFG